MAGAMDIQLAGNAYYFGKLYEKPTIGDAIRPVEVEDIRRSNRLLYATAILGVVVFLSALHCVSGYRQAGEVDTLFARLCIRLPAVTGGVKNDQNR